MDGSSNSKQVTIDGMDILHSDGKHKAMLFSTALKEKRSKQVKKEESTGEKNMEEVSVRGEESESSKEEE